MISASRPGSTVAGNVDHVVIAEQAHHKSRSRRLRGWCEGICCPGPFPWLAPLTQPGGMSNRTPTHGLEDLLGADTSESNFQPGVWNSHAAHVSARIVQKGKFGGLGLGIGHQGIGKGWICHVGQSDDSRALKHRAQIYVAPLRRILHPAASHKFRRHKGRLGSSDRRSLISRRTLEPATRRWSAPPPRLPPVPAAQDQTSSRRRPAPPVLDRPGRLLVVAGRSGPLAASNAPASQRSDPYTALAERAPCRGCHASTGRT